ncbi:MAG: lamin tail domain-containing protein [Candidatus Promineofilum sp.]|nr:lamin tail domain-containing protein [Promineifilum sp.]
MNRFRLIVLALVAALLGLALVSARSYAVAPPVVINEVLAGNATTNMDMAYTNYSPWVELYNAGGATVNLGGYRLSDDVANPAGYTLPNNTTIAAGGRLVLWYDELATGVHTSYSLDMRGDTIALFMPDGTLVDSLTFGAQLVDVAYGRTSDGAGDWANFDAPTPGAANAGGLAGTARAARPTFSPPGGVYAAGQSVTISAGPGAVIRYTTDGSKPTANSPVYNGPIAVNQPKAIRARAFIAGQLSSTAATATYLIGVDTELPVVALSTDPAHVFDNNIGIYVVGKNGAKGRCGPKANYNQPWERPVSMELYETNGTLAFQQDVGFEIQGDCTRAMPQKSLEIKTRRRYGDNDIDYAIFPGNPTDEYERLVLRGGGNHNAYLSMFREPLVHELHWDTMALDQQQYRPTAVFINGAYWGIHNLRDKADEALIEQNYGLDADDEFDMMRAEANQQEIDAGNTAAWDAFMADLAKDLTNPANYADVTAQMDVDEFMDFFIAHTYSGNLRGGEFRYWRAYEPGSVWRWVFADLDNSFQTNQINQDSLKAALKQDVYAIQPLKRMLTNVGFRNAFAQRAASHLNITYTPARVSALIDTLHDEIAPEMPAHIARWKKPKNMAFWETETTKMLDFAARRPAKMREHLNAYVGAPGPANLTVNVSGSGVVAVAGVEPLAYPFSGPYFRTLPLTLAATPAVGFRFVEWQETGETDPAITLNLSGNVTRTAVFEPEPPPNIVINEIHYNPADTQGSDDLYEFVELVNADNETLDLSGFSFGAGITYTFPDGASIAAGEIIVVAKAAGSYSAALPGIQVFQWASGSLDNGGEQLALLDANGNDVDRLTYDDIAPWPTTPDDNSGPSLSLLATNLDNALAASWAPSTAANGTPGAVNFP